VLAHEKGLLSGRDEGPLVCVRKGEDGGDEGGRNEAEEKKGLMRHFLLFLFLGRLATLDGRPDGRSEEGAEGSAERGPTWPGGSQTGGPGGGGLWPQRVANQELNATTGPGALSEGAIEVEVGEETGGEEVVAPAGVGSRGATLAEGEEEVGAPGDPGLGSGVVATTESANVEPAEPVATG